MFIAAAGIKPVVVHYKGGGPAIEAVVNNEFAMDDGTDRGPDAACAVRQAAGARGRRPRPPCAAAGRADDSETGYPGFDAVGWGGIFVPNGTPQPVIDKLQGAIAKAVTLPEARKQFEEQGTERPAAPRPRWQRCCGTITPGSGGSPKASASR